MKIFLGYASERLEVAKEVYKFLKTLNDDVWFDKESLIGGDDWDRERSEAQQSADFVVHLISSDVFSRPGVVNREIRQTLKLFDDQPIGATYVVFIRIDELRMPVDFIRFQYIDHFKKAWRKELALAVTKRLGQLSGTVPRIVPERTTTVKEEPRDTIGDARPAHVRSSVSTESFQVTADYLQYREGNVYWDFINSRLKAEALGEYIGMAAEFKKMDQQEKDRAIKYRAPHEWSFNMQEFFRHGEFLSVRSSVYWYSGGAHSNHGVRTLNFLGSEYGVCSINDLLGHDEANAVRLLDYCKKVLFAMFDDESQQSFIARSFEHRESVWTLASQFSFDDRGLTMNFSPYEVLPYAFGSNEVFVPWRFVTPLLGTKYEGIEAMLSRERQET